MGPSSNWHLPRWTSRFLAYNPPPQKASRKEGPPQVQSNPKRSNEDEFDDQKDLLPVPEEDESPSEKHSLDRPSGDTPRRRDSIIEDGTKDLIVCVVEFMYFSSDTTVTGHTRCEMTLAPAGFDDYWIQKPIEHLLAGDPGSLWIYEHFGVTAPFRFMHKLGTVE